MFRTLCGLCILLEFAALLSARSRGQKVFIIWFSQSNSSFLHGVMKLQSNVKYLVIFGLLSGFAIWPTFIEHYIHVFWLFSFVSIPSLNSWSDFDETSKQCFVCSVVVHTVKFFILIFLQELWQFIDWVYFYLLIETEFCKFNHLNTCWLLINVLWGWGMLIMSKEFLIVAVKATLLISIVWLKNQWRVKVVK